MFRLKAIQRNFYLFMHNNLTIFNFLVYVFFRRKSLQIQSVFEIPKDNFRRDEVASYADTNLEVSLASSSFQITSPSKQLFNFTGLPTSTKNNTTEPFLATQTEYQNPSVVISSVTESFDCPYERPEAVQKMVSYLLNGYLTLFCVIMGIFLNSLCIYIFTKFRRKSAASGTPIIQIYLVYFN